MLRRKRLQLEELVKSSGERKWGSAWCSKGRDSEFVITPGAAEAKKYLWRAVFPAEILYRLGQRELRRHSELEMGRGDQGVFGACPLSLSKEEKVVSCQGRERSDRFCDWLSEKVAPHSRTLAWKTPWREEPRGLQSMGSLRVGQDWATSLSLFTFMHCLLLCLS